MAIVVDTKMMMMVSGTFGGCLLISE